MKVVGLSGAQGAGKSTLLIELMARGWQLDQFRVSRAVQAQLGWDNLDTVMSSPETMMKFQNAVLFQKINNDFSLLSKEGARTIDPKGHIILTERTFADIVAYTNLWAWKFVDSGKMTLEEALDFLSRYTTKCEEAHTQIYGGTILLPMMDHVVWENDPNRAAKNDVEAVFEDIERFMDRKLPITHRRMTITGKTVSERADQVENFLRTL
jgi:hypothetical protein